MIRLACRDDLPLIREVERAASTLFRDLGMDLVADDEPSTVEQLAVYQRTGHAWVYVDGCDRPIGYLLVDIVDATAYIAQVSVHPDHIRRGIGRQLIDIADTWAARHELSVLTLTTYAEVPWNAPYYARLGFRVVNETDLSDGLRSIRAHEHAHGLDTWPRVTMRRP